MKKVFDEFCKLPLAKMSKKISEMTYLYQGTQVPDSHYKKLLDNTIIDTLSSETSVQTVLLQAVFKTLQALQKESPKLFMKALLCIDNNIKVEEMDARTYYALDCAYDFFEQAKKVNLVNQEIQSVYQVSYENGLPFEPIFDETEKGIN